MKSYKILFLRQMVWVALALFSQIVLGQSLVLNGSAVEVPGSCYLLTTDSSANQAGSIFSAGTYSLYAPFTLKARFNFGCDNNAGEGLAFVFAKSNNIAGSNGAGLGYEGLTPSLVVQFDAQMDLDSADPDYDHMAIMANGSTDHNGNNNLAGPVQLPELQDCEEHCLQISWLPSSKELTVTLDDVSLSYTGDVVNEIFAGSPEVYWGFTGATGNVPAVQRVCFAAPQIDEMEDIVACPGDSVQLHADPNGLSYSWFPSPWLSSLNDPNPTASPLSTTVFFVTITFDCGFEATDEVVYTVLPEPGLGIGSNSPVCEGEQLKLFAGGGDLFEWMGPNGFTSNLKDPVIDPAKPENAGVYTVTVTGANLCIGVHDIEVVVKDTVLSEETIQICGNETVNIFGTPTNTPGDYHMSFTRSNGCDSTHVIHLFVSNLNATFDTISICETETADIFGEPTNTPGDYQQTFTGAGGCDSVHHIHLIVKDTFFLRQTIFLCPGDSVEVFGQYVNESGNFSKTFQSTQGCDSTLLIEVVVDEAITLSIDTQAPCPGTGGGSISVVASGGSPDFHYQWSVPSANGPQVEGLQAGEYSVTVTDQLGCSAVAFATLADVPPFDFGYEVSDAHCYGEPSGAIELFPSVPGLTFSVNGSGFHNEVFFDGLPAGIYRITAQDQYGCQKDTTVNVGQAPKILLDLPPSYDIERGDSVRLEPLYNNDDLVFFWSPASGLECADCPDPLAQPLDTTLYILTATDSVGCQVSDSVWVNVELILEVMVPNVFTPNNDGSNDRFYLIGKGIASYSLRIFDRWGRLIYDKAGLPANDKSAGWDGTEKGEKVLSDTYIYQAEAQFLDGTRKVVKGEVLLVR